MAVDGSNRTVIARVPRPRAVVLDPCRGYVLYSVCLIFIASETVVWTYMKIARYWNSKP